MVAVDPERQLRSPTVTGLDDPRPATCFATCSPGLEPVLHRELAELRLGRIERQVSGVRFDADLPRLQEVNLRLATAVRVLRRLHRFPCADADALYRGVAEIPWERLLAPEGRLWIDARARDSALNHGLFVAQRTKDAIVDQLRGTRGARPSVDRDSPDLRIDVHVVRDMATVSLDSSGESLHKRGWRRHQGRAPLSECLAAGILRLAAWDAQSPLLDPFCGTGTLLVEAGLLATGRAPGLLRREPFAFERWPGHDARAFAALRERIAAEARPLGKRRLVGGDLDPARVAEAREHLAAAGIEGPGVEVEERSAEDFDPRPGWNAWVVTNPPYGDRVGEEGPLLEVYRRFGERLRERGSGFRLALLSGNPRLTKALGLKFDERLPLPNGGLDTELCLASIH